MDTTGGDADVSCPRLGWVPNHKLRSADDAPLMADVARATWVCAPGGKIKMTTTVDDPGVMFTVMLVALGKRPSIAVCTAAVSAALNGVANVS